MNKVQMTLLLLAIATGCLFPGLDTSVLCEESVVKDNLELDKTESENTSTNTYTYLLAALVIFSCVAARIYFQADLPEVERASWNLHWYSPRDYFDFMSLPRDSAIEMYNYWRPNRPQARIFPVYVALYKITSWFRGMG